jgi:hypothetical protein
MRTFRNLRVKILFPETASANLVFGMALWTLLIAITASYLAFSLYVSFDSEGGARGKIQVFAHALGVPLVGAGAFAVGWVGMHHAAPPVLPLVVGLPVGVLATGCLMIAAAALGERAHRRRQDFGVTEGSASSS